jgi:hypothetical protein
MMEEIERRKEMVRRVWDYRRVDHIPIMLQVASNPWGYTTQEHFLDGEKQFQIEFEGVKKSLEMVPGDYIPSMRVDLGCVIIESALGAEVVFGHDPNQTCTVKAPILGAVEDIYALRMPDPHRDGLVPEGLMRMKRFVERTDGQVLISGLDMGGPLNVAFTLLGSNRFYMMSYDAPDALEYLANFIADVFILFAEAGIEAVGGVDHLTSTDFPYWWQPEKYKGHMSDDICAQFSPEFFNRFSKPYNNKIFERFGGGMMHNCGPNPCAGEYLSHEPRIRAVDLAYDYSKHDLERFKTAFRGEGLIYFGFDGPDHGLSDYRHVMEVLAPDVICVPCATCGPDEDVRGLYNAFLDISREYAARMDWRGD